MSEVEKKDWDEKEERRNKWARKKHRDKTTEYERDKSIGRSEFDGKRPRRDSRYYWQEDDVE